MPLESAQILSTVARQRGFRVGYRPTHPRHPCTSWAGASLGNYLWLVRHGKALCREYTRRYQRVHACERVINELAALASVLTFERKRRQPFRQVMPRGYRSADAVRAYRNYYRGAKVRFARWRRGRAPPAWW